MANQITPSSNPNTSGFVPTRDGIQIFYKDWGQGRPVVFSHGWPLSADAWDGQMLFLGQQGYRVIAHDRRSHGRSEQTWDGNHMDQYADDLAALLDYRARAPHARRAHPTEEHFLPLFFALGAAGAGAHAEYLSREVMYGMLAMDAFSLG